MFFRSTDAMETTNATITTSTGQSDNSQQQDISADTLNKPNDTKNSNIGNSSCSNIQGIQQSLLRRNMAIMIRLQHVVYPERTIIVINAHLFWNPAFEYVKVRIITIAMVLVMRMTAVYLFELKLSLYHCDPIYLFQLNMKHK